MTAPDEISPETVEALPLFWKAIYLTLREGKDHESRSQSTSE